CARIEYSFSFFPSLQDVNVGERAYHFAVVNHWDVRNAVLYHFWDERAKLIGRPRRNNRLYHDIINLCAKLSAQSLDSLDRSMNLRSRRFKSKAVRNTISRICYMARQQSLLMCEQLFIAKYAEHA